MIGPVGARMTSWSPHGELKPDPAQARAVACARSARGKHGRAADFSRGCSARRSEGRPGVYLWGGVGRGKSMLMDLAFDAYRHRAEAAGPLPRVHARDARAPARSRARREEGDPIEPVAEQIAAEAKLLVLRRNAGHQSGRRDDPVAAVREIDRAGVKVVTTSNRPPRDLYKDGLNRELFLPFIELIERRMLVVPVNGPTDYRLERLAGVEVWHVPNGPEATAALCQRLFPADRLSGRGPREGSGRRTRRRRRPHAARAQEPEGGRGLLVQAAVRRAARRRRLSRDRAALSHRHHRRHSGDGPRDAQRGGAVRHAHRRALRA